MTKKRVPRLKSIHDILPIRTQADLEQHWRALMGPLGFSAPQLWLNVVGDDGRPTALLTKLEDVPHRPDDGLLDRVVEITRQLITSTAAGGSLAVLLARPGRSRLTKSDLTWAAKLTAAASRNGVPLRPIYLATDDDVRVIAPDDLLPVCA